MSGAASAGGATSRPTRARRATRPARRVQQQGFFDRYRTLLLAGFAVLGVGVIALVFFQSAGARGYTCESLLEPGATEPVPTAPPTFRPTPTATGTEPTSPEATGSPGASPTQAGSPSPGASPTLAPSPEGPPSPGASPSPGPGASPTAEASPSPGASPSPAPSPSQRLGFPTEDLGRTHVPVGPAIEYAFCPPTSGNHFDFGPRAPLPRAFYDSNAGGVAPGNWVHNLEHGDVVIAYRDPEGAEGPTADEIAAMRSFAETAPRSPVEGSCPSLPNKVVVVRFDDIATRFAYLAWDRALLTDEFDPEEALTFYLQWADAPQAPEPGAC